MRNLHAVQTLVQPAQASAIDLLQRALQRALDGDAQEVVLVTKNCDGTYSVAASAMQDAYLMIGALARLQHRCQCVLDERSV